ncbi:MAG TPA: hypothetical protein VG713_02575 [Pirellulales bacterium]|nr:hypothetical protein [Pirellulales bacterium]
MSDPRPAPPTLVTGNTTREAITDALRFWERARVLYNAALAAIVLGYFVGNLPYSRSVVTLNSMLVLFLLAVMANLCYCAVYVIDIFVQASGFETPWRKARWAALAIGTAFAAIITRFIAMGAFRPPM